MDIPQWIVDMNSGEYKIRRAKVANWLGTVPRRPASADGNLRIEWRHQVALYEWRSRNPDPMGELDLYRSYYAAHAADTSALWRRDRTDKSNAYTNRHRLKQKGLSREDFWKAVTLDPLRYGLAPENVDAWVESVFAKDRK